MNAQRLRNLTTGRLHTKMEDIYEDVEFIVGVKGVMTHMLPNALRAMEPWLRTRVTESCFWDGAYDAGHIGEFPLQPMTPRERESFWLEYGKLPHPFEALKGGQK